MKYSLLMLAGLFLTPVSAQAQLFSGFRSNQQDPIPIIVPTLTLAGPVVERNDPFMLFAAPSTSIHEFIRTLEKASKDPRVEAVVLKIESPGLSIVQAEELTAAMMRYRESEKPLYVYLDMGSITDYLVASAATEISMPPLGALDNYGIGATAFYFKNLLGKLGLEAQAVPIGDYKDAFEPFISSEMSDSTRTQLTSYIDDAYEAMLTQVAAAREVDRDTAEKILTGGPYSARTALELGAIDAIEHYDELIERITTKIDEDIKFDDEYTAKPRPRQDPASLFALFSGGLRPRTPRLDLSEKIIVVYAQGPIYDGRVDRSNPFASVQAIASDDFIDMLDEVSAQPNVKAVVIRIDSPGGSANASDRIWQRIRQFEDEDIPVIVSMSSVAASGGYYIGMAGDYVFADSTTITGSIGVIGGKIALGGTYEKLGIGRESINRGINVGLADESRIWTEDEVAFIRELLVEIYDDFIDKAALSRDMDRDELIKHAGGRIWSGTAAKEVGLIDQVGGLSDAILYAREIANADTATIVEYPKELTPIELIERVLTGQVSARPVGLSAHPAVEAARPLMPAQMVDQALFLLSMMKDRPAVMMIGGFGWEVK